MRYTSTKLLAFAVTALAIVPVVTTATSASAQSYASQRKIEQQRRTIQRQQHQILSIQRTLDAERQQIAGRPAQAPPDTQGGFLSGFCPPHYYVNLAYGCLPDLNYIR